MGRRPNQLVNEYFERGPKLEDASNRYQHTCKSCGEKFPKGRIECLTNHLIKKCPALPLRDRQHVFMQYHDPPADLAKLTSLAAPQHGNVQFNTTPKTPFVSKEGMSALETLAEVSRQHLETSGKRLPDHGAGSPAMATFAIPTTNTTAPSAHHAFDDFLIHDDRIDTHDMTTVSHSIDPTSAPALPSLFQYSGPLQHSPTSSPHNTSMPMGTSGTMNPIMPSLVMTASAATELSDNLPAIPMGNGLSEHDLNLPNTDVPEKFFNENDRQQWPSIPSSATFPLLHHHSNDQILSRVEDSHRNMSSPRPIAMHLGGSHTHFTTDFSVNQKPAKPKVRGRFNDTRRNEVREIRKRGACIRCRMLKKPCSEESPCNTCQNVESARLWKQPCIRTRIAELFNLYSAGLHGFLAFQAVNAVKAQARFDPFPGRLEATAFPESDTFVTFSHVRHSRTILPGTAIDPAILASLPSSTVVIIDYHADDFCGKLEPYMKKMALAFQQTEDSAFMKTTLRVADNLSQTNPESLLPKVVELWNLTRLLTSSGWAWDLFFNPSLAPTMVPSIMSVSDLENGARVSITPAEHTHSFELIKVQLQGGIEKRAAVLAPFVMNELERRLLQRQQVNSFETFLVAVILLACAERMCWLYRTWEEKASPTPTPIPDLAITAAATAAAASAASAQFQGLAPQPLQTEEQPFPHTPDFTHSHDQADANLAQALQSASSAHRIPEAQPLQLAFPPAPSRTHFETFDRDPKWPFDKTAAYYWQQGERFSDILNMLLKMRNVPPKPVARETDGMLVVVGDNVDTRIRDWYEGIEMTVAGLAERAEAKFVGEDPKEWEGKYWSKIIGVS